MEEARDDHGFLTGQNMKNTKTVKDRAKDWRLTRWKNIKFEPKPNHSRHQQWHNLQSGWPDAVKRGSLPTA